MNRRCIVVAVGLLAFLAISASLAQAAGTITLRPYGKFGYLLTSPSASDLGYVLVDGGDLDDYLDVSKTNYGAGVQIFLGQNESWVKGASVRYGIDVGFQKLFSSEFQAYDTGTSTTVQKDGERDFYMLGLVELVPSGKPFFLQAGLGLNLVFWSWESEHEGYSYEYDSSSGTGTNLGFMIAGGMNLPLGKELSLPVMIQLNNILRYGLTSSAAVVVGFDFKM